MAISYKKGEPRNKGYSFKGGKLFLGDEQQTYGPKNDPKASPVDKAGLISKRKEDRAEKGWKLENEDGTKTDVGVPYTEKKEEPKIPNFRKDPKATQQFLKDQGYNIAVDGKFGKNSRKALDEYNKETGNRNVDKLRATLDELGIKEKSYAGKRKGFTEGELSSGGDLQPGTAAFAQDVLPGIKDVVGDNLRLTGGNDAYHASEKYLKKRGGRPSAHTDGRALDIAVTQPKPKSKYNEKDWENINNTWESFREKAGDDIKEGKLRNGTPYIQGDGWRVLNEYERGTGAATGGHFHIVIFKDGKWVHQDPH